MLNLSLIKSSCTFVTSDFPSENPRKSNRNYFYNRPLCLIFKNEKTLHFITLPDYF